MQYVTKGHLKVNVHRLAVSVRISAGSQFTTDVSNEVSNRKTTCREVGRVKETNKG